MGARFSQATRFIKKPLETQRKVDKILENKPKVAPSHPSSQAVLADARKREYFEQILPCSSSQGVTRSHRRGCSYSLISTIRVLT